MFCRNCGTERKPEHRFCAKCGAQVYCPDEESILRKPLSRAPRDKSYELVWFKFLIKFALYFGAVFNVVFGIIYMTGVIYPMMSKGEILADGAYRAFGYELEMCDNIYGISLLFLAVFWIVTRFMLAKFKKAGPMCLYILCGLTAIAGLAYHIEAASIKGEMVMGDQILKVAGISILVIFINYIYFLKRKDLFCN